MPLAAFIGPVMRKEFRQIKRDSRSLIFMIFIPAFLLLMFGFALNFDVKHIPLAIVDQDGSRASRELAEKFRTTEYFDLKAFLDRPSDVDGLMARERIRAALVIPETFSEELLAGRSPSVQFLLDGANAMSGTTAGMFLIGKTNPERMKVGRIVVRMEMRKATCWVRVMAETRIPCPRPQMRKRTMVRSSRK